MLQVRLMLLDAGRDGDPFLLHVLMLSLLSSSSILHPKMVVHSFLNQFEGEGLVVAVTRLSPASLQGRVFKLTV